VAFAGLLQLGFDQQVAGVVGHFTEEKPSKMPGNIVKT
jgi:hypothetical protein